MYPQTNDLKIQSLVFYLQIFGWYFRDHVFESLRSVSGCFGDPILAIFFGFGYRVISDQTQLRIGKEFQKIFTFA